MTIQPKAFMSFPAIATPPRYEILPPVGFNETVFAALRELLECARSPLPFMVDRQEAARLCSMSPGTYDKYAAMGLLPKMNAAGKVLIETLRRACLKLDGIAEPEAIDDPAERALRDWESK